MKIKSIVILSILILAAPCSAFAEIYHISMIPRHSAEENFRIMTFLAEYLSGKSGVKIEPVITANYMEFEKQVFSGNIDMSIENPTIYTRISEIHEVIATAVDELGGGMTRGLVITGKNSDIKNLTDLKGKTVCIVSRTSSAGFLSPKLRLLNENINVEKDCTLVEAVENKQENVIFSVLAGDSDAGFIKESAFSKADGYIPPKSIRIVTEGIWIPNDAFSVKKTIPGDLKKSVLEAIKSLKSNDEIMKRLGVSSWVPVLDSAYDPVRKALEN